MGLHTQQSLAVQHGAEDKSTALASDAALGITGEAAGAPHGTTMRSQMRVEYTHGDDIDGRTGEGRIRRATGEATGAATRASANVSGVEFGPAESLTALGASSSAAAQSSVSTASVLHSRCGPAAHRPEWSQCATMQGQRGGISLDVLARNMRGAAEWRATSDAPTIVSIVGARPRTWHLDDGDQLKLLHSATARDTKRSDEILELAHLVAGRAGAPSSVPHIVTGAGGSVAGLSWVQQEDGNSSDRYLLVDES